MEHITEHPTSASTGAAAGARARARASACVGTPRGWATIVVTLGCLLLLSPLATALTLQRALAPLAGGPSWLRLHHACVVNLEESEMNDRIREVAGDSRCTKLYVDFLPQNPRDPR